MIKKLSILAIFSLTISLSAIKQGSAFDFGKASSGRSYIYIVGSSTISPLMAAISEEFSHKQSLEDSSFTTPVVESSGTIEGFDVFCEGVGEKYPDFTNASRAIEENEIEKCNKNGVKDIVEIKIGYDGIVIGNSVESKKVSLTKEQVFLALAQKVADKKTGKLINNPYSKWSEIDPRLPNFDIIFYGPPSTSGTREVFAELLLEKVCLNQKEFIEAYKDITLRKKQCHTLRGDGKFVESGENDNLIIKNLKSNPQAFGFFGFNFLVENGNVIQAVKIDGTDPSFDSISSKKYQLSRPLFVYFKKENINISVKMREFIKEIISVDAIGNKGYLSYHGLVTLSDSELRQLRKNILLKI